MVRLKKIIALIISVVLFSCSPVLKSTKIKSLTANYCEPNIQYDYSALNAAMQKFPGQDSILRSHLSAHDGLLSEMTGIAPHLAAYYEAKDTLTLLMCKQKITDRLLLTNTELEAIVAELDCNGERIDQLAAYVDDINKNRNTRLTVASVVLGALTTVATVALKNDASTAAGVAGGLTSAGLGALTINPKGKRVALSFKRNLLKNIWNNDNADQAFPPAIWKILNEKAFSNSGDRSLIETIKNRWLQYEFEGKISPVDQTLFFDKGGIFTADDLHSLANMFNELQATIRSVQQDMRSLGLKVNSL